MTRSWRWGTVGSWWPTSGGSSGATTSTSGRSKGLLSALSLSRSRTTIFSMRTTTPESASELRTSLIILLFLQKFGSMFTIYHCPHLSYFYLIFISFLSHFFLNLIFYLIFYFPL